jgi:hypothetical protein
VDEITKMRETKAGRSKQYFKISGLISIVFFIGKVELKKQECKFTERVEFDDSSKPYIQVSVKILPGE